MIKEVKDLLSLKTRHSEMLRFTKRWVLVGLVILALVLILTVKSQTHRRGLYIGDTARGSVLCPATPPTPPYIPLSHDRFDWRSVSIKHPVDSFRPLPSEAPLKAPSIQHRFAPASAEALNIRNKRKDAVRAVFERGWNSYKQRAWLHDELAPVSGGSKDTFGGWAATLVDSLDTLWIMGMRSEFEEAVAAAVNISFSPDSSSLETLNMFEITIRHLGGFLAAYDLTNCKDERLLQKAVEVGDMIYASYDTPNRMPVTRWNPRKADQDQLPAENGIIAEMASASVEFVRLSQLTGDMRYYDAVARITDILDQQQGRTRLPGMFPLGTHLQQIDVTRDTTFSFGAMADSAFEYFPKTYQLLRGAVGQYRKLYEGSTKAAIDHLLFRPSLPEQDDVLISANYHSNSDSRDNQFQHLTCFAGGMFLLGGRLFDDAEHVDIGRRLTDGCVYAYRNGPLGIMPEICSMKPCPSLEPCDWDDSQESIFTGIGDARYILRPEAIESVYYAYRITGDEKYQDLAWDMFEAIEAHTQTTLANSAIVDLTKDELRLADSMESFWMSETLKYFYLVFSDPMVISLDEWVFNTEAHPVRVPSE